MNVVLSGDAEQFVRKELDSGRYDSAREIVQEAIHLLRQRTTLEREQKARLDEKIVAGLSQLDRGEGIPGEEVFQALWEKSRARREEA